MFPFSSIYEKLLFLRRLLVGLSEMRQTCKKVIKMVMRIAQGNNVGLKKMAMITRNVFQ